MKRLFMLAALAAALLIPGPAFAAFSAAGLTKIADDNGAPQQTFFYTTSDATQTVTAADYFLSAYQAIVDNSLIFVEASDGTLILRVTASTSSTVTVGEIQGGGKTMTAGSGFDGAETEVYGVFREGGIIITRIMLDITGLIVSATDLDIIGESAAAANSHFGQITEAVNGTIVGMRVTCLEVPAGAADDIDIYAATEGTGAEDAGIATLVETALVTSGAAWASGTTKGATALPAADKYLYLTAGEATANGTYTAGKFVIELYGTP